MKTYAYIRISCHKQDTQNQRLEILEYANKNNLSIDEFIEIEISSRKDRKERRIDELINKLNTEDTLITSELSRIGRSTGEVIDIVNALIAKQIKFIAIKQGLTINGKHDLQSKVLVTLFSLLSELERDLLSFRTIESLKAKKAQGVILGRPKGSYGVSKLDAHKGQIQEFLKHRVPVAAIARMLGVSRTTLIDYIKSRKIVAA